MASPKQLHRLATNPHAMARFQQTGRLPEAVKVDSPLIRLLEAVGRGRLDQITGLTIGPALGYRGHRQFATAAQALHWLKPPHESFTPLPSQSWQDRHFTKDLYLEDLLNAAAAYPPSLLVQCARLRRPGAAAPAASLPEAKHQP